MHCEYNPFPTCPGSRLGSHLSIAGGHWRALEHAGRLELTALQIFTKSSGQWRAKPLVPEEVALFRALRKARPMPVLAHASYLINMASPDGALRERSAEALAVELSRAAELGLDALVLHPGAALETPRRRALARAGRGIAQALAATSGGVSLLIENTAGQGSCLGCDAAELAELIDRAGGSSRIGVCIDTCHLFAAGHDIRSAAGWRRALAGLDAAVGRERLGALHLNDSKQPLGSRLDRHAHIGQGHIGLRAFAAIMRDPALAAVPKILETPKGKGDEEDAMNLALLRGFTVSGTASAAGRRR